jgi:hypothetical protein
MHPCVFEGNTTILLNELKLRNEGLGFMSENWSGVKKDTYVKREENSESRKHENGQITLPHDDKILISYYSTFNGTVSLLHLGGGVVSFFYGLGVCSIRRYSSVVVTMAAFKFLICFCGFVLGHSFMPSNDQNLFVCLRK